MEEAYCTLYSLQTLVVACYSFFATRTHLISREGAQTAEEDERSFGAAPSTKDLLPTAVTAALHQY